MTGRIFLSLLLFISLHASAQTYMNYVDSADYYIQRGMWKDAERATVSALKLRPANKLNYLLWSNLGEIRSRMEDYDGALQAFDIALASEPGNKTLLNNRAYTLMIIGKDSEALEDINASLKIDSVQEWPLSARAGLLLSRKDLTGAWRDYSLLKDRFPKNPASYKGLGQIEALRGNSEAAIGFYEKAIENGDDEDLWFYLVTLLIEKGELPQAKEKLFTAMKRFPRSGNLFLLRGVIHKLNYENEAAQIDRKIALEHGADTALVEKLIPADKKKNTQKN